MEVEKMTNEKTDGKLLEGVAEAFSFRKGVVKISGRWFRFGPEVESTVRGLTIGETVSYLAVDGTLKRVETTLATSGAAVQPKASIKAQAAPPAQAGDKAARPENPVLHPPRTGPFEDRNRSIERQVALKAAVELAGLYGYKSTRECLDVAATFAAWIEADYAVDLNLPQRGAAEAERGPSPRPSGSS
jgi:hypothetical protein